ncbi:MAG: hypothetical protein R6V85_01675 [Polyangia bacterium]
MSDGSPTVLVLGFPGGVARAAGELLAREGRAELRIMASERNVPAARRLADRLAGAEVIEGDSERIDFGLCGERYLRLVEEVDELLCLEQPLAPGEGGHGGHSRHSAREVIELFLASRRLRHLVVLSSLEVAGEGAGRFSESDLDTGQSFWDDTAKERFRVERIYSRFFRRVPLTVMRSGWLVGAGEGLVPLAQLLLAAGDDLGKSAARRPMMADAAAVAGIAAGLVGLAPARGGRVMHLLDSERPSLEDLCAGVTSTARLLVPEGFDLQAGAQRSLRRSSDGMRWSQRELFRRIPEKTIVADGYTRAFLKRHRLPSPDLGRDRIEDFSERAVEEIVGFK